MEHIPLKEQELNLVKWLGTVYQATFLYRRIENHAQDFPIFIMNKSSHKDLNQLQRALNRLRDVRAYKITL